jgi:hypothetical protein
MNLFRCFHIYKSIAIPLTIYSTGLSTFVGIFESTKYKNDGLKYLTFVGGHTCLGIIAGISYPISIPFLAYKLLKK